MQKAPLSGKLNFTDCKWDLLIRDLAHISNTLVSLESVGYAWIGKNTEELSACRNPRFNNEWSGPQYSVGFKGGKHMNLSFT